ATSFLQAGRLPVQIDSPFHVPSTEGGAGCAGVAAAWHSRLRLQQQTSAAMNKNRISAGLAWLIFICPPIIRQRLRLPLLGFRLYSPLRATAMWLKQAARR